MPFKTLIKAAGINNLTDARFFSSFQVNWLSFNFDPLATNNINIDQAKEIKNWLAGPKIVGEFNNQGEEEILFIAEALKLDGVQVQSDISFKTLKDKGFLIFRELKVSPDAIPLAIDMHDDVDYVVLEVFDIEDLEEADDYLKNFVIDICSSYSTLLSFPFRPENIDQVLEIYKPAGVNIYGSEEVQTGVKAFNELADILEKLEM